ncbi:MAG TPA: DUF1501 domain-containing protein [Planctomycetaceae bacterium]|jgi:hypothetical protein
MLNLTGSHSRLCDSVSRRELLRIGALGLGGLTLPQLLAAESRAGSSARHKAVIMIYLVGAPPHQDMYDLKMEAPQEIRGEFQPIATNVPGIRICEHLPRLAGIMDKLVPIRSMYGSPNDSHDSFICYTGRSLINQPSGGWPALGPAVSKFQGGTSVATPAFVGLAPKSGHPPYGSPGHPGMLGIAHSAFRPTGPGLENLVLGDLPLSRLDDRRLLLRHLDGFKRQADQSGMMAGLDVFNQQAFGLLTSGQLVDALDLSKEDPRVRERYGKGDPNNYGDGAPRNLEHFLIARRLVQAGVRVVTLNFGRWDFHEQNFSEAKNTHLPYFDQGMSALVEDLHALGMADDVAVVAWGEFGRTPRINQNAGRDHWAEVGCGLLAGGGFRTGQLIGATDRLGASIAHRPVHFGEVFASLYRHLGLDPHAPLLTDLSGRPHNLVDGRHSPLRELV